jgi:tRNA (mo5U34)-methyltransferase
MALSAEEKQARIEPIGWWWHSIDLGDGVVSPGRKFGGGLEPMVEDLERIRLPEDLSGRTVLDVGAYDGFYSFAAERRNAARVVALDHFVWLNDLANSRIDFATQYVAAGKLPDGVPLPGKRAFDTAHEILGSRVESVVGDFMHYPLDELGTFDVVLYLGIIYHMEDPLRAMRRLLQVTGDLAIIESETMSLAGFEDRPLAEFFPGDELNGDPTNWWVPNAPALIGLARAAGFAEVEVVDHSVNPIDETGRLQRGRATLHARRHPTPPPEPEAEAPARRGLSGLLRRSRGAS